MAARRSALRGDVVTLLSQRSRCVRKRMWGVITTLPIIADVRAPLTNLYLRCGRAPYRFSPYQMPASLLDMSCWPGAEGVSQGDGVPWACPARLAHAASCTEPTPWPTPCTKMAQPGDNAGRSETPARKPLSQRIPLGRMVTRRPRVWRAPEHGMFLRSADTAAKRLVRSRMLTLPPSAQTPA